jgi:hypothetical protein
MLSQKNSRIAFLKGNIYFNFSRLGVVFLGGACRSSYRTLIPSIYTFTGLTSSALIHAWQVSWVVSLAASRAPFPTL